MSIFARPTAGSLRWSAGAALYDGRRTTDEDAMRREYSVDVGGSRGGETGARRCVCVFNECMNESDLVDDLDFVMIDWIGLTD